MLNILRAGRVRPGPHGPARPRLVWVVALCLAALVVLWAVDPGLAASAQGPGAGGTADPAANAGDYLKGWGQSILLAVVGLVGIGCVFTRRVGEGITLVFLAVLIGGFFFAPGAVENVISAAWRAVGGG